jgi:hypothetical protein
MRSSDETLAPELFGAVPLRPRGSSVACSARGRKRPNLRLSVCVPSESMCHSLEVACITTRVECTFAERRQPNDRRLVGRSRATRSRATWQPRASGHCGCHRGTGRRPRRPVMCSARALRVRVLGWRAGGVQVYRGNANAGARPGPGHSLAVAGKVTSRRLTWAATKVTLRVNFQVAKFKLKFALYGRFDPASPPHWMTRSSHAGPGAQRARAMGLCVRICKYLLGLGFRITQLLCIAQ